jgi:hypothetical protein
MQGRRQQLLEEPGVDSVPVGGDLHRADPGPAYGPLEEPPGCLGVPARREEHVDDLAELVDGPEQVAPRPSDLQVGLIHVPVTPDDVPAGPSGLGELRGESLDPPVDAHVVDIDSALCQELLHVPI